MRVYTRLLVVVIVLLCINLIAFSFIGNSSKESINQPQYMDKNQRAKQDYAYQLFDYTPSSLSEYENHDPVSKSPSPTPSRSRSATKTASGTLSSTLSQEIQNPGKFLGPNGPFLDEINVETGIPNTLIETIEKTKITKSNIGDISSWFKETEQNITLAALTHSKAGMDLGLLEKWNNRTYLTDEEYAQLFPDNHLPNGNTFICSSSTICKVLKSTIFAEDFVDVNKDFQALTSISNLYMPHHLRVWCTLVAQTSTPSVCFLKSLANPKSYLGTLVYADWLIDHTFLDKRGLSDDVWKAATIGTVFGNCLMPKHYMADKAQFYIALLQNCDEETQRRVHKYLPRTYYIHTPCEETDQQLFDQWDLWLDDYYQGNPPEEFLRHIPPEYSHYKGASMAWREKQDRIDGGANLWVSKPTNSELDVVHNEIEVMRNRDYGIHTHEGNAIQILNHPSQLPRILDEDNAKFKLCVGNYRIFQKYVEKPTLLENKKVDIRMYVLATSLDPVEAYFLPKLVVRQARNEYNVSSIEGEVHVTNLKKAQREEGKDIIRYYVEYRAWIADEKGISEEEVDRIVYGNIRNLIREVLTIVPNEALPRASAFMGWDIMLDETLSPWLLEINLLPDVSLHTSDLAYFNIPIVLSALEILLLQSIGQEIPSPFHSWILV